MINTLYFNLHPFFTILQSFYQTFVSFDLSSIIALHYPFLGPLKPHTTFSSRINNLQILHNSIFKCPFLSGDSTMHITTYIHQSPLDAHQKSINNKQSYLLIQLTITNFQTTSLNLYIHCHNPT